MKKLFLALAAVLGALAPAAAADLTVKTKAVPFLTSTPCTVATATTPLSCSGFYIGGGISGQGTNADIVGNGINGSVFAGGMVLLSFAMLYQDRLLPLIDALSLHALCLALSVGWQAHLQGKPDLYVTAFIAMAFKAVVVSAAACDVEKAAI